MVVLVLTAMLHLTVATHYCGGEVAASKISISGKLASCGMEAAEKSDNSEGTQIRAHCCEDVLTTYGIDNTYTPSYSFLPENTNNDYKIFNIPADLAYTCSAALTFLFTDVSPPGYLLSTDVDLTSICVFRI
jgi:hypothetical protein